MGKDLKGKELGQGIVQRKNGRYEARFTNRFGKRISFSGYDLKDVKKRYNESFYENEKEINIRENIKLDDWYIQWMNVCKYDVIRPDTKRHYNQIYKKHISPYLGNKYLKDIKQIDIKKRLKELDNKGYGFETKNKVRIILLDILNKAIVNEYLCKNPVKGISVKRDEEKDIKVLSVEEQSIFFDCCKGTFYDNLYVVAVTTGMRIGDDDDKIRLNQRKPSKYKGLSRFGPEKNLQRINKFMKERPTFYKKLIQMKENFRFYLRCFYCITKVVILQFNSEKQDRISS
jgi:hypothetical protein